MECAGSAAAWSANPQQRYRGFRHKVQNSDQCLGIDASDGDAQPFGASLFQRGKYVVHDFGDFAARHAADTCEDSHPAGMHSAARAEDYEHHVWPTEH